MGRRGEPNPAVIAILEDLLLRAKKGKIQALYALARFDDGEYEDIDETDDFDGLVLELRTRIMILRNTKCEGPAPRN
jgi:hypothetical protein